ncbi:unnamed protein product [Caenorhabditis brenneri]
MGHSHEKCDHGHGHAHAPDKNKMPREEKALWIVATLSGFFMVLEFVGGFMAGSLAIMADAAHMLSDFGSFIISIIAIRCARLPPTIKHTFGFKRAETLGALISILILWMITGYLAVEAVQRIKRNDGDVDPDVMLITAGFGVFFNVVMLAVLKIGGLGHSHGPGQDQCHGKNVNVRAAFVHVLGDFIQSIGVVIAALVIKYVGYELADPICTLFFSLIVLITTLPVMRDIVRNLMEATPKGIDLNSMKTELLTLEGVKGVHNLHVWSVGMSEVHCSVHLGLIFPDLALTTVTHAADLLKTKFGIKKTSVQVEHYDPEVEILGSCCSISS